MSYETAVQKETSIHAYCMGQLRTIAEQSGKLSFITIKDVCEKSEIDPYAMAACLSQNYEIINHESAKQIECQAINPMCLTCKKYGNDCKGENNLTYTGCIYKRS